MQSTEFTGLAMPVFTAFGWAGEENAINYALSELELFIKTLHASLPRNVQEYFPAYGLDADSRTVYLAVSEDLDSAAQIIFYARPMSMEMQVAMRNKPLLTKVLSNASSDTAMSHRLITELGPDWSFRIQQMQVDEDSGEASHYHEIFADTVSNLDEETAVEVLEKAAYLNGEAQWITPMFLSRRFDSEQIAAMGNVVINVIGEQITALMPLLTKFTGNALKSLASKRKPKKKKAKAAANVPDEANEDSFTITVKLKPFHLRRGFINLTPEHWPFFAINSRSVTRDITIYYEGIYDKNSSAWHLVSTNQTRIVLSPAVHEWMESNFEPNDRIQVVARKLDENEIQLSLRTVE